MFFFSLFLFFSLSRKNIRNSFGSEMVPYWVILKKENSLIRTPYPPFPRSHSVPPKTTPKTAPNSYIFPLLELPFSPLSNPLNFHRESWKEENRKVWIFLKETTRWLLEKVDIPLTRPKISIPARLCPNLSFLVLLFI